MKNGPASYFRPGKSNPVALRRFFIPTDQLAGPDPCLQGDEARHLLKVLRLKIGDEVILFDNSGLEYRSRIRSVSGERVIFEIEERKRMNRESPLQIALGVPLIRSLPFEWILQKGTELGVSSFHPFFSAHSSRNFQKGEQENRINRWERIILEAAKQCRRNTLPELQAMVAFPDLLKSDAGELKILPHQEESGRTMGDLPLEMPHPGPILILIGPEGGFSEEEVGQARGEGFVTVSLGPRVLRSETAALVLISLCQFLWGDMSTAEKGGEDALP
jgi:16S rRNA (uracil1498-N3)-methyltransferase